MAYIGGNDADVSTAYLQNMIRWNYKGGVPITTGGQYQYFKPFNSSTSTNWSGNTPWNLDIPWLSAPYGIAQTGIHSYVTSFKDEPAYGVFNGLTIRYSADDHLQALIINGNLINFTPATAKNVDWGGTGNKELLLFRWMTFTGTSAE